MEEAGRVYVIQIYLQIILKNAQPSYSDPGRSVLPGGGRGGQQSPLAVTGGLAVMWLWFHGCKHVGTVNCPLSTCAVNSRWRALQDRGESSNKSVFRRQRLWIKRDLGVPLRGIRLGAMGHAHTFHRCHSSLFIIAANCTTQVSINR